MPMGIWGGLCMKLGQCGLCLPYGETGIQHAQREPETQHVDPKIPFTSSCTLLPPPCFCHLKLCAPYIEDFVVAQLC